MVADIFQGTVAGPAPNGVAPWLTTDPDGIRKFNTAMAGLHNNRNIFKPIKQPRQFPDRSLIERLMNRRYCPHSRPIEVTGNFAADLRHSLTGGLVPGQETFWQAPSGTLAARPSGRPTQWPMQIRSAYGTQRTDFNSLTDGVFGGHMGKAFSLLQALASDYNNEFYTAANKDPDGAIKALIAKYNDPNLPFALDYWGYLFDSMDASHEYDLQNRVLGLTPPSPAHPNPSLWDIFSTTPLVGSVSNLPRGTFPAWRHNVKTVTINPANPDDCVLTLAITEAQTIDMTALDVELPPADSSNYLLIAGPRAYRWIRAEIQARRRGVQVNANAGGGSKTPTSVFLPFSGRITPYQELSPRGELDVYYNEALPDDALLLLYLPHVAINEIANIKQDWTVVPTSDANNLTTSFVWRIRSGALNALHCMCFSTRFVLNGLNTWTP